MGKRQRIEKLGLDGLFDAVAAMAGQDEDGAESAQQTMEKNAGAQPGAGGDSAGDHRRDLERLEQEDPEFFAFLKENDSGLLDFDAAELDDDEQEHSDAPELEDDEQEDEPEDPFDEQPSGDEEEADDDEDDEAEQLQDDAADEATAINEDASAANEDGRMRLELSALIALEKELSQSSGATLRAAKTIVRAFRAGCRMSEYVVSTEARGSQRHKKGKRRRKVDDDDDDEAVEDLADNELDVDDKAVFGSDGSVAGYGVVFANARVYQRVMSVSIQKAMDAVEAYLGRDKQSTEGGWAPKSSNKWKKIMPVVKTYSTNLIAMTRRVRDEPTVRLLLKRCESVVPYLELIPKLARKLVKLAVSHWVSDCEERTFLRAHVLLTAVGRSHKYEYLEDTLKLTYRAYYSAHGSKCNTRTLPRIRIAANSITELHGIDMATSYTHGFVCIRQLALDLRSALTSKGKEDIHRVYNWQYVNCLRLWSLVLSQYSEEQQLRPLIYPYVQITLAVMRLVPVPKNYGVRFHCAVFLNELAAKSGTYIPLAPALIEPLTCSNVKRGLAGAKSKAVELPKQLDWRVLLRVPEAALESPSFTESVVRRAVLLLAGHYAALSRHVAFPEAAYPTLVHLRRIVKETKVAGLREEIKALVHRLQENSDLVMARRGKSGLAPDKVTQTGLKTDGLGIEAEEVTPMESMLELLERRVVNEERLRDASTTERGTTRAELEVKAGTRHGKKLESGAVGATRAAVGNPIGGESGRDEEEDAIVALSSDDDDE